MAGVSGKFLSCALVFWASDLFPREYSLQANGRATRNVTKFRASYTHCLNLAWSVSSSAQGFHLVFVFFSGRHGSLTEQVELERGP